ncbi:MAG: aconitate hydratase AcnA [Candidatus Omnitrophica bacterium]|nr:aconitate hydratase AcnA [Candidatus Omnitrophota bacterium]
MNKFNPNDAKEILKTDKGNFSYFSFEKLAQTGLGDASKLPFSIKVLLESTVRNCDNYKVRLEDIKTLLGWTPKTKSTKEIAFKPGRVILQDFTGVPCVVDLAAMRSAIGKIGGDIKKINPQVRCDLIIDHSLQVDYFGDKKAFEQNLILEFKRNKERYEFLKWGQNAFKNFNVVPPATGIIHQINLEHLATGLLKKKVKKEIIIYPDSLVGTDSHTTMINGLGIVGWGVGGIEAEAVMLGEPIDMVMPEVVGFKLTGRLPNGVTATDLVLTIVQMLRKHGVVDKFVEFYGNGLKYLSLPDRATISNMGPEYGATIGIFPVDRIALDYYKFTGRDKHDIDLLESYLKAQGMFYDYKTESQYSSYLELDLSTVEPCISGPKRPQDRVLLKNAKTHFQNVFTAPINEGGFNIKPEELNKKIKVANKNNDEISNGSVVLASITSCTNTSNPTLLIIAGLIAKKAVEKGLTVKDFVKTSFTPGSKVAEEYLSDAGLLEYLEKLKFNIVGYGCATCIGNSGALPEEVAETIKTGQLIVSGVVSGNRNFEGRINPHVKANYLASPPLVIAYALAGTTNIDFAVEPVGVTKDGEKVFLRDIWPSESDILKNIDKGLKPAAFKKCYKNIFQGDEHWAKIKETKSDQFEWNIKSTYIQEPPFFTNLTLENKNIETIKNARVLVMVGDSITTDHISPAGSIAQNSPAGKYLLEQGVQPSDFNSYGSRRGNDKVMVRGTFANIRLRNKLAPGTEGSFTTYFPKWEIMNIFDAAGEYAKKQTPLLVLAGKEYGTGSSRDWAAKGTALLGIRTVLAESYERIHRSNLAGMGVLPLQFNPGITAQTLGLQGDEIFNFEGIDENLKPRQTITVHAKSPSGRNTTFTAIARLDTPVEIDYFRNGGILPTVLKRIVK